MGGNYFPDGCYNAYGDKPWPCCDVPGSMKSFWEANADWYPTWNEGEGEEHTLKIDYIRVYQ